MTCDDCKPLLAELLYAELPEPRAAGVHTHLSACAACRGEYERMRRTRMLLDSLDDAAPVARVETIPIYRRAVERSERSWRRWRLAAAAAATVAAVALVAIGLGLRLEVHQTHVVLAWGPAPAPVPRETIASPVPAHADPWPELKRQRRRLAAAEELLNLAARELLDEQPLPQGEFAELRRQIDEVRRENDARWRLIAAELTARPPTEVAVAPLTP